MTSFNTQKESGEHLFNGAFFDKLPKVRGKLTPNAALQHLSWLNVGGPAEVLFRPADRDDLIHFIRHCPPTAPMTTLGVMSNCIIRDGGIPGIVLRLGREFAQMKKINDTTIEVGSGALDMNVAQFALKHNLTGMEFLSGIPGTIGGALRMNAGAYGREVKDILVTADVLFRDGEVKTLKPEDMDMRYRHNGLPKDVIFLSAVLRGEKGDPAAIKAKMDDIKEKRGETQPIREKTSGSTFANPSRDDPSVQQSAWELIDAAGCRGLQIGGAQMSEMHCNFMINTGDATAADLEALGEEVRRRVFEHSGVTLRWEVKRIGVPLAGEQLIDIK